MPVCLQCSNDFPNRIEIDGKVRVLNRRKYCLDCSEFGQHNTRNFSKSEPSIEHIRQQWTERTNRRRRNLKTKAIQYKGGKCCVCGYDSCDSALEFHHTDPSTKKFDLTSTILARKSWSEIQNELDKCILVCANHHREIEAGLCTICLCGCNSVVECLPSK